MSGSWRRYLLGGAVVAVSITALPFGIGRDLVYTLVGASGVVAILRGVHRNNPPYRHAWYLMAAGLAAWVLGDAMYAWYQHIERIEPFPSPADVPYLAAYPVLTLGLLVLVRSRGPERRPTALLDGTIFTIALGLEAWVFLIQPTWAYSGGEVTLDRLVAVAYPLGDVLLCAMLVRLGTASGTWNTATRLLAGSVTALLVADGLYVASAFVPAIDAHVGLLDPLWLVAYVLWGTAALHPSMRALSGLAPERAEAMPVSRLVGLTGAVMTGPMIIAFQLVAGLPLSAWAAVIATTALAMLVLVRMVGMVSQLQAQAARLGLLADTDYVTGLMNRAHFANQLGAALRTDARHRTGAILLVDLDRFTELNDTLGHRTGDAILHAVGARLGELAGDHALVARLGDSVFGILDAAVGSSPDAGSARLEADGAAVRIRADLERPLELAGVSVSVEVSIGVLRLVDGGAEAVGALQRAELALSAAQVAPGRTARYAVGPETDGAPAPVLVGELPDALEHGDIVLHYQPQIDLATGRVFGVEALARWQHPRHGLLGPDSFIAAAERAGMIGPLTTYVLDHALRECARWRRSGLDLTVAVNLSVLNLLDPGLVDDVVGALARHGLDAAALELEITEGSAMIDPRRSVEVLGTLATMGVTLSIDDYGAGHSSLTYLQRLPVQRLKIDRSFVARIGTDDASAAIVASTIELARHLNLQVVAEGVEDDETLLALRSLRCFAAQGFGLGRPVAGPLLPALVARVEERLRLTLAAPAGR